MKQRVDLHTLLSQATDKDQQIASFALLSLGVIESLVGGAITASSALELFFHADNCLFVRKQLRQKVADEIMSRGVQLPDIFDALSAEEAQQEFQRELATMRLLCLKFLGDKQLAA
jgi:cytochrome P450